MYKPFYDAINSTLIFIDEANETYDFPGGQNNVFVCGALQDPEKMGQVLGHAAPFAPGVVRRYGRGTEHIGGRKIPFMLPAADPTAMLTGIVWLDLSESDISKIEALELKGNLRKRTEIQVHVGDKILHAMTFIKK